MYISLVIVDITLIIVMLYKDFSFPALFFPTVFFINVCKLSYIYYVDLCKFARWFLMLEKTTLCLMIKLENMLVYL